MYCVANGNSRKMKSNLRIWVVNGCPCYTPLSLLHHNPTNSSLLLLFLSVFVILSVSSMAALQSLAFTSPLSHCCKQSPPLSGTIFFLLSSFRLLLVCLPIYFFPCCASLFSLSHLGLILVWL